MLLRVLDLPDAEPRAYQEKRDPAQRPVRGEVGSAGRLARVLLPPSGITGEREFLIFGNAEGPGPDCGDTPRVCQRRHNLGS
jgi:hypothetical protein